MVQPTRASRQPVNPHTRGIQCRLRRVLDAAPSDGERGQVSADSAGVLAQAHSGTSRHTASTWSRSSRPQTRAPRTSRADAGQRRTRQQAPDRACVDLRRSAVLAVVGRGTMEEKLTVDPVDALPASRSTVDWPTADTADDVSARRTRFGRRWCLRTFCGTATAIVRPLKRHAMAPTAAPHRDDVRSSAGRRTGCCVTNCVTTSTNTGTDTRTLVDVTRRMTWSFGQVAGGVSLLDTEEVTGSIPVSPTSETASPDLGRGRLTSVVDINAGV